MPSISLRLNVVKVSVGVSVGDASIKTEFRAIARRGVLAWRNSLLVKRIGIESRPKNEKGGLLRAVVQWMLHSLRLGEPRRVARFGAGLGVIISLRANWRNQ